MSIINWASFLLAIVCAGLSWEILRLIGGRGRIITLASFGWLIVVRGMVLTNDHLETSFPTASLAFGFYVLMSIGLTMLVFEIRSTLKGQSK